MESVYHMNCNPCAADYVENQSARWRPSMTNSEVSQHIHLDQTDCTIDLGNSPKILAVERKRFPRKVKEAIFIRANRPSFIAN